MNVKINQSIPKEFIHTEFILDNPTKKKKIKKILTEPSNKECFDCGQQNPEYISLNNGIFICRICATIHRQFPEEISSIRQNINSLTDKELLILYKGGNQKLSNFVTYEFPGLQNYTPEILYKTKAMEYYRERLKYYSGMSSKPFKPNDLIAYKLIDEEPNNIQKFRRHNNNLRRFLNCVAQRNFNNGSQNYSKTNSRIETDLGISNSCSINCNFNGCNNSINFLNKNTYIKKKNNSNYKKPITYKKSPIMNFKINNTFDDGIQNDNLPFTNSYVSPRVSNSPKKFLYKKNLTQKRSIDYSNEDKEPDSCENEIEVDENYKHRPLRNYNTFNNIRMRGKNIYLKPQLKNFNNIYNNYKNEEKGIATNYAIMNSSSYNGIHFPNNFNNERLFIKHKPTKSSLSNNENKYNTNNNISNVKIRNKLLDYNNSFEDNSSLKNKRGNSEKSIQKLIYNRTTNTKYYFTLKDINNNSNTNYNTNNSLNERSSLNSQKNITYNINYISINEDKANDEQKKTTIPVLKVFPNSPIFVNRKKNKNSKLSLFHSNNSTGILHNKPKNISKYSKTIFNRNNTLKNKSKTMNYNKISYKASQDKKEQEDLEKKDLEKLKSFGNLGEELIYSELTNPGWNTFRNTNKMGLDENLPFGKTNNRRNYDMDFQIVESGNCDSTLGNRYKKIIREKNEYIPKTARENYNENIRKNWMNIGYNNSKY